MKIAITGHTAGIGKAFASLLSSRGHEIIGISRRDGENIRRVKHTASLIEPCDLFISNATSMFAQTELLYEVWQQWRAGSLIFSTVAMKYPYHLACKRFKAIFRCK